MSRPARRSKPIEFLFENSLFLPIGALLGLIWANVDHASYEHLLHVPLLTNSFVGTVVENGTKVFDLHFLVNEVLMAIFFAIAGKEVFEAFLPGGPLNKPREAATPLIATIGGVLAPAGIYLLGAHLMGHFEVLQRGWAIPCATDIAFSYMVARLVFGALHPAIPFLLLLAIVDDAIGLLILAIFYPQKDVAPIWLLLVGGGILVAYLLRRARIKSFWPYLLLAGGLSWLGFAKAGLHPALGLLPVIPVIPHAHIDLGLIDWRKLNRTDTLTQFEHWWAKPVQLILALFGLLNAGVVLEAVGAPTWLVLAGLILGKPLGIWLFGMLAARVLGFGMPGAMGSKDLLVVGFTAAIGFTVALFVATVAFPPGIQQDAAKMGALLSLGAAGLAIGMGKLLGIERKT